MKNQRIMSAKEKALELNLDDSVYGTFAEIGAGQEVARNFFQAGGAAGTMAKSMSAYDMKVSDDIYGKSNRYVSENRLKTMILKEYEQLTERLSSERGDTTTFFSFADTVAAKSYKGKGDCHGWMGVRFQHEVNAKPSEIIIHVRMFDRSNLQQQDVLGIVGVNLLYAVYRYLGQRECFIGSLRDNIDSERLQIDMIEIEGPAFEGADERLWSLELVKQRFCESVMFNSEGCVVEGKDALYGKNILVCRGSFRPPTLLNLDMLKTGKEYFKKHLPEDDDTIVILPEISMNKLLERGSVDNEDFLARMKLLTELGHNVLISNYETYGDLNRYLSSCTKKKLAFILGYYNLQEVFNQENYKHKHGGLFEGLGDLLGQRTTLFCYPAMEDNKILRLEDAPLTKSEKGLIDYLENEKHIVNIEGYDEGVLHIWSRVVLEMIQKGRSEWEKMVPDSSVKMVKENKLFDHKSK